MVGPAEVAVGQQGGVQCRVLAGKFAMQLGHAHWPVMVAVEPPPLDLPVGQARERRMPRETVYIVQAYVAGRGKALKAEQQVGCKSAEEARRKAERVETMLSTGPRWA